MSDTGLELTEAINGNSEQVNAITETGELKPLGAASALRMALTVDKTTAIINEHNIGGDNAVDLSFVTATAGDILSGKVGADANGNPVNGSIAIKDAVMIYPDTWWKRIPAGTYLAGDLTIAGEPNLLPENIADGVSIFNVQGTHKGGMDEIEYGYIDENGMFQKLDLSGDAPVNDGIAEFVSNAGFYAIPVDEADYTKEIEVPEDPEPEEPEPEKSEPIFYASLSEAKATAETGQALSVDGDVRYKTFNGVPCLMFNGTGCAFSSDMKLAIGSKGTVSLWFCPTKAETQHLLKIGYGDDAIPSFRPLEVLLDVLKGDRIEVSFDDITETSPAVNDKTVGNFVLNVWQHFLCVSDGINAKAYLNGQLVFSSDRDAFGCTGTNIIIGAEFTSPWSEYDNGVHKTFYGGIAAVRVYDRVLSEAEITELANEFTPVYPVPQAEGVYKVSGYPKYPSDTALVCETTTLVTDDFDAIWSNITQGYTVYLCRQPKHPSGVTWWIGAGSDFGGVLEIDAEYVLYNSEDPTVGTWVDCATNLPVEGMKAELTREYKAIRLSDNVQASYIDSGKESNGKTMYWRFRYHNYKLVFNEKVQRWILAYDHVSPFGSITGEYTDWRGDTLWGVEEYGIGHIGDNPDNTTGEDPLASSLYYIVKKSPSSNADASYGDWDGIYIESEESSEELAIYDNIREQGFRKRLVINKSTNTCLLNQRGVDNEWHTVYTNKSGNPTEDAWFKDSEIVTITIVKVDNTGGDSGATTVTESQE